MFYSLAFTITPDELSILHWKDIPLMDRNFIIGVASKTGVVTSFDHTEINGHKDPVFTGRPKHIINFLYSLTFNYHIDLV